MSTLTRRGFLQAGAAAAMAGAGARTVAAEPAGRAAAAATGSARWPLVLNTSTIRPASLDDKIAIAAEVGYDGIELWINDLEEHEKAGHSLEDLGKRIRDRGLFVPNVIGLWSCMPPGEDAFEASLPATRERMRRAAAVGSTHVAAIPTPDRADFDLAWATHCYRRLLVMGLEDYGITAAFEFVGFLKGIHRLGQAAGAIIDADHPKACLVADTFHCYRGGSGFKGLALLNGAAISNFHWNDVPPEPAAGQMGDEHRIFPGAGILPLVDILRDLDHIGYRGPLSLEMFNRAQWERDPRDVAAEGLDRMRAGVEAAFA